MGTLKIFVLLSLVISHWSFAEVRYVSHSGSNTPPYLTWETAADSIMSAINISSFGDTVYVANGVYEERVTMIPVLSLIGAGMDSCIIDTRNFIYTNGFYTINMADSCFVTGFNIKTFDSTHGNGIAIREESGFTINSRIEFNKIQDAAYGIILSSFNFTNSHSFVHQNWISSVYYGIGCELNSPIISENYIYVIPHGKGIYSSLYAEPLVINNIVTGTNVTICYSDFGANPRYYNNLLFGAGAYGFDDYGDTIVNNIVYGYNGIWGNGITGAGSYIRNNHIEGALVGLYYDIIGGPPPDVKYNNFWKNQTNFEYFTADSTNIYSDPMFVNEDSLDFHLQMYSPLIDAGDPNILDKDGSRSDIGLFGGPYGEKYTYRDLAPKPPSNLTASYDSGLVLLRWSKNTEADFYLYRVYRDTVADFIYDTTRIIAVVADTFFYDDLPEKYMAKNYYYKITALDRAGHQSAPSEEVHINITGVPEGPPKVVEHYQLLNNYPNPFNSGTIIPYRLKEPGYVKLYIYDIKGELVRVLVNQYQQSGYYEVRFDLTAGERKQADLGEGWWTGYNNDMATGIYLYQIMVRGEGNIPVFTDMGKMILLK